MHAIIFHGQGCVSQRRKADSFRSISCPQGAVSTFWEVKPGAETSPRKATVLQTLGVYRVLPDSEARSTASRKSWASPLVAWSWAMKTRSDLGTPRKEIPEETAWETERQKALARPENRMEGPLHPTVPGQRETTKLAGWGGEIQEFISVFLGEPMKISWSKSTELQDSWKLLRNTPWCDCTSQSLHFLPISVLPGGQLLPGPCFPGVDAAPPSYAPTVCPRQPSPAADLLPALKKRKERTAWQKCWDGEYLVQPNAVWRW